MRERKIPKPGGSGKVRKLGIPTVADRVVQAALKLVLEPIFEADFVPVSFGFRPNRRAHDAIAEIHHFGTGGYRVGAGRGHRGVFGVMFTLLLSLIVMIKTGCFRGWEAGYAGLSCVRCG